MNRWFALSRLLVALGVSGVARAATYSWPVLNDAYAGDATIVVASRFLENGTELATPTPAPLPGPWALGEPKRIDASPFVGSGRTICLRARNTRLTSPVATPDSPEVESCATFPAALQPPAVGNLQQQ